MDFELRLLTFVALSALLIVTPGPDTALIIRNSLTGGPRASTLSAIGVGAGTLAWMAAAVFGIGLLLVMSVTAFTVLKLAGAAYLCYLGIRTLLSHVPDIDAPASRGRLRDRSAFAQGLISNLLNPKTGAFFLTVMPQFVVPGDTTWHLALLVGVYEAMLLAWLIPYGHVVSRLGRTAVGRRVRVALTRVTGVILVGLGLRLAFERR